MSDLPRNHNPFFSFPMKSPFLFFFHEITSRGCQSGVKVLLHHSIFWVFKHIIRNIPKYQKKKHIIKLQYNQIINEKKREIDSNFTLVKFLGSVNGDGSLFMKLSEVLKRRWTENLLWVYQIKQNTVLTYKIITKDRNRILVINSEILI